MHTDTDGRGRGHMHTAFLPSEPPSLPHTQKHVQQWLARRWHCRRARVRLEPWSLAGPEDPRGPARFRPALASRRSWRAGSDPTRLSGKIGRRSVQRCAGPRQARHRQGRAEK
eukprot:gene18615-biopygen893